jgi:hypothetical protein
MARETEFRQTKGFLGDGRGHKRVGLPRADKLHAPLERVDRGLTSFLGGAAQFDRAVRGRQDKRETGAADPRIAQRLGYDLRADPGRITDGNGEARLHRGGE